VKRALCTLSIVSALTASPARAQTAPADPDPWFGKDKALHFGASAVIAGGGYAIGAAIFPSRGAALALGGGLALGAGTARELADLAGLGTPSWRDFFWDVAGTIVGLAVAWSVDMLVRGVDAKHPPITAASAISPAPRALLRF
jgi:putative lipoprotein